MKTLSGTVTLVVLAAVAVVTAFALRGFAQSSPAPTQTEPPDPPEAHDNFVLKIKPRHSLKDGSDKGEEAFMALMNSGKYEVAKGNKVHLRHAKAAKKDEYLPRGAETSQLEIKTDKVTVSQTALEIEAGDLTVIQPHVTVQIASKSPADIKAVLDLMAP
jgi:hypothetical protein